MSDFYKGVALVLAATFFFNAMDICAKAMTAHYEPFFVVWFRYASQALLALAVFAPALPRLLRTRRLGMQILRSSLLFAATILFFYGFSVMPLADVIAVAQVTPLAITGFAALLLREEVGPIRWAGVAAGFIGALVILRPGFSDVGWAALFPFAGALCFAAYGVATRFLGEDENPWTTFLYTGSVGAVAASLAAPLVWQTPQAEHLPVLLTAGVFGGLGQGALIFAFSYAPASALAPFFYVGLIWATASGYLFFDHLPDLATVIGAAMIVGAGLLVQWREAQIARRSRINAAQFE